jgi:hypothetical protein
MGTFRSSLARGITGGQKIINKNFLALLKGLHEFKRVIWPFFPVSNQCMMARLVSGVQQTMSKKVWKNRIRRRRMNLACLSNQLV